MSKKELIKKIKAEIKQNEGISVSKFMEIALFDNDNGSIFAGHAFQLRVVRIFIGGITCKSHQWHKLWYILRPRVQPCITDTSTLSSFCTALQPACVPAQSVCTPKLLQDTVFFSKTKLFRSR